MNIRDLRYIVSVADHGHFRRAAAACHVTQPALSIQLRKLQDDLDTVLFEWTTRAIQMTPTGTKIVRITRETPAHVDLIEETAVARRDPLSGPLRLGMILTIGYYLTPLLLSSIAHPLPTVKLDLFEDLKKVLEGSIRES